MAKKRMVKAKLKKRNPQDTTLRNLRALKERVLVLEGKVDALMGEMRQLFRAAGVAQQTFDAEQPTLGGVIEP